MKTLKYASLLILALLLWSGLIGYGVMNGFLLQALTSDNTSEAFIEATKKELNKDFIGNFAITLLEDGKVSKNYFYSIDQPVDENTVFPVASISKWVTSFGVLKLVEQGN